MTLLSTAALIAVAGAASAQTFTADDFGFEIGVSTLGTYIAPEVEVIDSLKLRLPIYGFNYADTFEVEGNDAEGELDVSSFGLVADYYIWRGLRVSAGVLKGGYSLSATLSDPTLGDYDFEGETELTFGEKNEISPVVAVGYAGQITKSFGLMIETGLRFNQLQVAYTTELITGGNLDDFDAELAEINKDLEELSVLPYLGLGLTWSF